MIIISNRLPVKIDADGNFSVTYGGLASALSGIEVPPSDSLTWVGWSGSETDPEKQEKVRQQLRNASGSKFRMEPVFLTNEQVSNYYDGYSNASLWPILHYFSGLARFSEKWYQHYFEVNRLFCECICQFVTETDLVWIHDYHLMLLPQMLREKMPNLRIGFFLHVPFPSYELFRCIPQRKELIEGLMGADLIGFHTFSYVRHFKSCVGRCLGVECGFDTIRYDSRLVTLGVHPIGINWTGFQEAMKTDEFRQSLEEYGRDFYNRKLVLSVSRLDYTKGIPAMLEAIEYYLANMEKQDITFLLIAVPSRDGTQSYVELKERVVKTIGEINGKYSQISTAPPIQFIHYAVNVNKLAALYSIADVALVIPLIDGMNLVAKEFIAVQPCAGEETPPLQKPGFLVLSEFTGASPELFNSLIVNPHDSRGVAEAIEKALKLTPQEKMSLNAVMRQRVRTQDADYWANGFLNQLRASVKHDIVDKCFTLSVDELVRKFTADPGQKALFLDYDGTLVPIASLPDMAVPPKRLLATMEKICSRPDFVVSVVSGRHPEFLEKHLGHIKNLTLVAEHGYCVRYPGDKWQPAQSILGFDWKQQIKKYLDIYVRSTPGSFIEDKTSALVWHYRKSELELGQKRAADLMGQLSESVHNLPVEIHHGKKIVEVSAIDISKGRFVEKFIREKNFSSVLCIGDDTTDETMFKLAIEHQSLNMLTVKIGIGDTTAMYRWLKQQHVLEFLEKICLTSQQS